jgi:hypothetical protein
MIKAGPSDPVDEDCIHQLSSSCTLSIIERPFSPRWLAPDLALPFPEQLSVNKGERNAVRASDGTAIVQI